MKCSLGISDFLEEISSFSHSIVFLCLFALETSVPFSIPGSGRSTGEEIGYALQYSWASLVAQLVKNLPAIWET